MIRSVYFLFNFYINASIHVSLGVFSLLYIFLLSNNLVYDEALVYTIFYGTITGYNFVKYAPIAKLHHRSLTKNLRLIQLFSLICFFVFIFYAIQLPYRSLGALSIGFLIMVCYALPISKKKNLRSVAQLKIYLVALCWAISIILVPVIHFKLAFEISFVIQFFQIFVLVIALIIPFDIRDLKYDSIQLKTIPQQIGIKKAKILAVLLLLVYLIFDITIVYEGKWIIPSIVMVSLGSLLILKMPKEQSKYYCSFGIESLLIAKLLLFISIDC